MPITEKEINVYKNGAIYRAKQMNWIGDEYNYLEDIDNSNSNKENSSSSEKVEENNSLNDKQNTETSKYSNTNSITNNSANNNSSKDETISIYDIAVAASNKTMTIEEAKIELEKRGLKVKIKAETIEVPITEMKENYWDFEGETNLNKGETVELIEYVYKGTPVTVKISAKWSNLMSETQYYPLLEKVNTLPSEQVGMEIYINNDYIGTIKNNNSIQYTVKSVENLQIKLVAPYAYRLASNSVGELNTVGEIQENVLLNEYNIISTNIQKYVTTSSNNFLTISKY